MSLPATLIEGKYEILAKMREGGMGTIYRVRHRLLDEVRVIKVLRSQALANEEMKRRFIEEARTATRLKHVNIGTIHDFAIDEDGKAYLVMEYIDGVNLAELLKRQGPPGLALALEIAHQALLALGYLHRKNIVHRDVAPDNLMLTHDEDNKPRVKLIDLGIAKTMDRPGEMTSTGVFLGKIKYASPEQFGALTAGEKIDGRSDIYALGVVLYELLTGVHPFLGTSPSELLRAHIFDPPLPFSQTDKEGKVPPELRAALQMAMEKRREDRFSTAEEFDRAIVELQQTHGGSADLDDTAQIISRVREIPSIASEPTATASAQDRIDRQFVAASTPHPSGTALLRALNDEKTEVVSRGTSAETLLENRDPFPGGRGGKGRLAAVVGGGLGVVAAALLLPGVFKRAEPQRAAPPRAAAVPTVAAVAPPPVSTAAPAPESAAAVEPTVPPQPTAVAEAPGSPAGAAEPSEEGPRREAEQARAKTASARQRAERQRAAEQAEALYQFARGKETEARELFGRGEFAGARAAFTAARDSFAKAEDWARRHPPARPTAPVRVAAAEPTPRREPLHPTIVAALAPTAALAPVRAPTTAPAVVEPPRAATEEEKIRDAIRRYEKAQSTLDADLYSRIYPSVDRARVRAAFDQLRSQNLVFEIQKIEVAAGATTAVVRGLEKRDAVPQVGTEQHSANNRVITLEKHGDAWVIAKLGN